MEANFTDRAFRSIEESDFFWPGFIPSCGKIISDDNFDYSPRGIKAMDGQELRAAGKPLHLRVQNLIGELGVRRVAQVLGVSEGRVYKYGQDPDVSGADIPLKHLCRLLAEAAADTTQERQQELVTEIIQFFAVPARRRVIRMSDLDELAELVGMLRGECRGPVKRPAVVSCPECGDQLRVSGELDGQRVYVCRQRHSG